MKIKHVCLSPSVPAPKPNSGYHKLPIKARNLSEQKSELNTGHLAENLRHLPVCSHALQYLILLFRQSSICNFSCEHVRAFLLGTAASKSRIKKALQFVDRL
jgi:hypothetical protein